MKGLELITDNIRVNISKLSDDEVYLYVRIYNNKGEEIESIEQQFDV